MNRRAFLASAVTLCVLPAASDVLWAQTNSRAIRMLVPFAPGGAPDSYAHLIADHMGKTLGRAVIVDHRPGANGNVGTQYVAREPADGNLILVATQATTEIN